MMRQRNTDVHVYVTMSIIIGKLARAQYYINKVNGKYLHLFSHPGSRWRTKNLTYKISKYPTGLNKQEVDKEIAKAFGVWSGETDLTFTRKTGHETVR